MSRVPPPAPVCPARPIEESIEIARRQAQAEPDFDRADAHTQDLYRLRERAAAGDTHDCPF